MAYEKRAMEKHDNTVSINSITKDKTIDIVLDKLEPRGVDLKQKKQEGTARPCFSKPNFLKILLQLKLLKYVL